MGNSVKSAYLFTWWSPAASTASPLITSFDSAPPRYVEYTRELEDSVATEREARAAECGAFNLTKVTSAAGVARMIARNKIRTAQQRAPEGFIPNGKPSRERRI